MMEQPLGPLSQHTTEMAAMAALVLCSGFFSASEAALFSLSRRDRRRLMSGGRAGRVAVALLDNSEHLLTAVLFWNLLVNLTYFTIASITSIHLQKEGHPTEAGVFLFASLLVIIVFSEMAPKSLAVMKPVAVARLLSVPLAASVRVLDPIQSGMRLANLLSRRLLWPHFEPEPYLRLGDLERAVQLSTTDAALLEQEQAVLESILRLSGIRTEELMRPRLRFESFRPPVSLADLQGRLPPSEYLLVTEPDSDEIAAAIALKNLSNVPSEHLELHADPVVYVPWCSTVAEALEAMRRQHRQVAAVVNEFGETIGIFTFDDVLDTIFISDASRSERVLSQSPIRETSPGVFQVTGMTSLGRLVRYFKIDRPSHKRFTVAGVLHEELERLPEAGDECRWGRFRFRVTDVPERGQLLVELTVCEEDKEGTP